MKKGSINPHLYKARVGNCLFCNKEYRATKDFKERKQKYCSLECKEKDWSTRVRPNIKSNPGVKGELNHAWKGDNVGYYGIHAWVIRNMGKPLICEHCKDTSKKKYEWASKDHLYKRDLTEWLRLCTSCHRKYDKSIGIKINQW